MYPLSFLSQRDIVLSNGTDWYLQLECGRCIVRLAARLHFVRRLQLPRALFAVRWDLRISADYLRRSVWFAR
jgi:hypothetical protein